MDHELSHDLINLGDAGSFLVGRGKMDRKKVKEED